MIYYIQDTIAMMIGTVMFLGGFCASLLAFYGRNAPLLMLAAALFSFCWVGNEQVHKAFRSIPIALLALLGVVSMKRCVLFITNQHYFYLIIICFLMIAFLMISLLPSNKKDAARLPARDRV